jgi:hypothetical protein
MILQERIENLFMQKQKKNQTKMQILELERARGQLSLVRETITISKFGTFVFLSFRCYFSIWRHQFLNF